MSFWDNVKKFTQPYADDDYEDEYEDDLSDTYEETPEPEVRSRGRRRPAFGFSSHEDSASIDSEDTAAQSAASEPAGDRFSGQVINLSGSPRVALHHITVFKDSSVPADDLRKRKAVIVNMENVDKATARRIVDFLSGCIYAIGGKVKKVSQATYLFSPSNVEVEGDLENLEGEVESYL